MSKSQERILVVENDPIVGDLIARQALGGQGYQVKLVQDAGSAIQAAGTFRPDVVIANLELPGLSGKDLMAALSYQQVQIPVIMTANKGQEADVIRAFRLGASDYLLTPVRETEVVAVVERALKTVRARKERQALAKKLEQTNQELKTRVDQLTTLFSIGKAITSVLNQKKLFKQIVEGAVKITHADYGWLLTPHEQSSELVLRAHKNLPRSISDGINKPWDDGLSRLVAQSGEALILNGGTIDRFRLSSLGKSALVVPLKVQEQSVGVLVVMRKSAAAFHAGDQAMLEAVSDYAAISLVNARLFQALEAKPAA